MEIVINIESFVAGFTLGVVILLLLLKDRLKKK